MLRRGRAWCRAAARLLSTAPVQTKLRRQPLLPPPLPPPSSFPPASPAREQGYFLFEVLHESRLPGSRARVGRLHTKHGVVNTPGFVPVGTNAALKAVELTYVLRACRVL